MSTDPLTEIERAIVEDLQGLAPTLRNLGHAHARLDANARYLIARTIAKRFTSDLSAARSLAEATREVRHEADP